MSSATITKQITQYLPLLTQKQQESLLEMVKSILQVEPEMKRVSIKQYNKELKASSEKIKKGKGIKHSDIVKEYEKW